MQDKDLTQLIEKQRERHSLTREFYSDPDIFERDVERIFLRSWLYAGHQSEIPEPGDWILFDFAGEPVIIAAATRDGGSGPDDFAVFSMNSGEALVYQGTYPGGADWAIVGVYNIGEPLSIRSSAKFGGDFFVITRHDSVSMSEALQGPETQSKRTKVWGALRGAVDSGANQFGWEVKAYPKGQLLVANSCHHQMVIPNDDMEVLAYTPCRSRIKVTTRKIIDEIKFHIALPYSQGS